MMRNKYALRVPMNERTFIRPDVREKVFKEIANGYKKRFNIKLLYAFLNTNPEFQLDYGVIYKARSDDGIHDVIVFDMVPIYSDRCTPVYLYYKKLKKEDNFFNFGIEEMVNIDPNRFYEFLKVRCLLDRDKNSENYWKNPKHAEEMCDELLNLSLPYVRKKPPVA